MPAPTCINLMDRFGDGFHIRFDEADDRRRRVRVARAGVPATNDRSFSHLDRRLIDAISERIIARCWCDQSLENSALRERTTAMLIEGLIETFLAWCSRHRSPATVGFYRTRLRRFSRKYNDRDLATLTPLDVDEHLAEAAHRVLRGEGRTLSPAMHWFSLVPAMFRYGI